MLRVDPAASRGAAHAALSLSAERDRFVSPDALRDAIARWAAPLPRTRQPDDARRRAAVAVACALSELLQAARAAAIGAEGVDAVPENLAELADRAGLGAAQAADALALLLAAGCVERVVEAGAARVGLAGMVVGEEPALARVAWAGVRARLRAAGASVLPAQAVLRAIALQGGAVPAGGVAPVVACTQESLAAASLLGRTAVVSALRALADAALIERSARRGTWTECRLSRRRSTRRRPRRGRPPRRRSSPPAPSRPLRRPPVRRPRRTSRRSRPPRGPPPMALELGGVRVSLAPGAVVEAPVGATITFEVDAAGRRYVCLGPGVRLGPLP
jgi:hypothetical protein